MMHEGWHGERVWGKGGRREVISHLHGVTVINDKANVSSTIFWLPIVYSLIMALSSGQCIVWCLSILKDVVVNGGEL